MHSIDFKGYFKSYRQICQYSKEASHGRFVVVTAYKTHDTKYSYLLIYEII